MPKLIMHDDERVLLVDLRDGESVRIGRSRDCEVPIGAPRASRHHAEIVGAGGRHVLRDLGSTNGTLLGGAPFTGDAPLSDGDVIEIGGSRIVFRSRP
jgi:pSer/pThr/pTyr-binding forkhead associated (FHA) protein